MGCSSCTNKPGELPLGCNNNGACGVAGCGDILDVHDWLSNVYFVDDEANISNIEVKFKGTRKGIYRNSRGVKVEHGDLAVVEAEGGFDIGKVSMKGELVRLQMKKKGIEDENELPVVLRKANHYDLETYDEAKQRELPTLFKTRRIAKELGLVMKLSDVEYQRDNRKATFYYTAEGRVDFRELIKVLARTFKIKVEMRQIGLRQEAGRLGGIGDCGRELCCSTWLTDFNTVPTAAAKYQNLFLNPLKLSGQCGRLKCCLNYELDTYLEALDDFPGEETRLETGRGTARNCKIDILKRLMWFEYEDSETTPQQIYPLSVETVKKILEMNENGELPQDLSEFMVLNTEEEEEEFQDVVGQDSLTRFDQKKKKGKRKNKNRRRRKNRNR